MKHEKSRILTQQRPLRLAPPSHPWATAAIAAISVFGMVAAFGTAPSTLGMPAPQQTIVEQLAVAPVAGDADGVGVFVREERIARSDSLASLLARLGIQDEAAARFLRESREANSMSRQLRPGKVVTARIGESGSLDELVFPLNGDGNRAWVVKRQGEAFAASEEELHLETRTEMRSGEITYSLFGATDAAGIPDGVAVQLADIFAGDIDFHRDLRRGDRFALSYELTSHFGRPVGSGRILAAEFTNNGRTYRAVWYPGGASQGGYYTPEGRNIRKAFLRSPLEFSRVTSGFTAARLHPILNQWRAHKGVDYGAPTGTKVKATGDGAIEFVGNQSGYGRVVILRHQGKFTTLYGHLSAFAAGLKKGGRVSQSEVIGYVGMSGWATGPHLHYEFRINDVHQDPLAVALPEAPPLAAAQLAQFRDYAAQQTARLDMARGNALALLD